MKAYRGARRLGLVAALGAAFALGGCGTVSSLTHGKPIDYKSAGTLPSLEVPPDLTAPTPSDRYDVPAIGTSSSATLSGYQAERKEQAGEVGNSDVLPKVAHMRIERDGTERWLVVSNETPEQLWPLIKDFWQENGFLIKTEIPAAGVMETDWAENRAKIPQDLIRRTLGKLVGELYSTPERDKFRTRLEHTPDGKGTEIYISHRGMQEVYVGSPSQNPDQPLDRTMWEPRPPDPGLEAEFLRRLMVRLGADKEQVKEAAVSAPRKVRAELKPDVGGTEMIEVLEPFDRAWRRVGLALDRVGFTVQDQNREKGLYYVRYADPEAEMDKATKPSLLSRLAFWRSNSDKAKPEQYQVQVKQVNDNSQIRVLNKDGVAEKSETASKILALLNAQLK
ncbi:MAG TPA: outer membrane protein assembly factor BamC [Burkholderiales bacterium]|nr:outer membrane protein assembly factor BamC [Burkholderiales bacterium]